MMNSDLWETANGVLSILGLFIVMMVLIYLVRNAQRTYDEPIRFITLSFALIVLGHTLKDGAAYLARCCSVTSPDGLIIAALTFVALGKLGCIKIWSEPKWGHWPWIIAVGLVGVFLVINGVLGSP